MAAFKKGDRVAWSHELSVHAEGSVLRESAVPAGARKGEVIGAANDEGTYFEVAFDGEQASRVVTFEELVKVRVGV